MSRLRGNAGKKKTRLTERSLSNVIALRPRRDETDGAALESSGSMALDTVDILQLLRTEPDETVVPSTYNDPSLVFTGAPDFAAETFVLGLMICPECRNEMVYYQRRDRLAAGYRFRCRVCQHELLATLP